MSTDAEGSEFAEPVVDAELGEWHERVRRAVFLTRVICRGKGYALGVHGTLRRDVDLIAAPWTDDAVEPAALAQAIVDGLNGFDLFAAFDSAGPAGVEKPLGRRAWAIVLAGSPVMYLDLSIAPPARFNARVREVGEAIKECVHQFTAGDGPHGDEYVPPLEQSACVKCGLAYVAYRASPRGAE